MRYHGYFLVLVACALLCLPAAAATADSFTIASDTDWLVAGGTAATISVGLNGTQPGISIAKVLFSCQDETYGQVTALSDSVAPYLTTFTSTKSGTAPLQAEIWYYEAGNASVVYTTLNQKIDHTLPYRISSISYPFEMTVNETATIAILMQDRFGNLIENRRELAEGRPADIEKVRFTCSPDDAGFWNGAAFATSIADEVDASGSIDVMFKASQYIGTNTILVEPAVAVPPRWLSIPGIGDADPVAMTVSVQPNVGNPPFIPADGQSRFFLTYILTDGFGNPSGNTTVVISTSLGESYSTRTNSDGQIMISYGPRDSTGVITVTARSAVNASVITHQNLEFVSTAPTDMLLTASPQVMPSHDVDAALTAAIRAKVMDTKGNPVDNETVTFQIVNIINDSAQTSPPVLLATSALTNQNGYAIVEFVPGTFETDWQAANFDETATATCDVVAIWNATSRTLPLEWKNFPYLSVETEVFPETVAVNDTVDVTIRLIGNGWALQPDPIDVMLCMDRSGSMLQNNPDRMVQTISAAKIFNAQMSPARDQVGLVSFGNWGWTDIFSYSYRYWAGSDSTYYDDASYIAANYPGNPKNYGGYATLDLPLSYDHAVVEAAIEGLVPYGGTPMRYGLYEAGKELIANSNPKAVKAAILLSDGDWNTGGDPKGGYGAVSLTDIGTGSVITWMANNNIKIYTIRLGSSGNEADLTSYAAETGGRYYYAPSGDDLAAIYTEIAGDLKTEASVDTEMDIAFTGIEVNNATYAGDAADVVRYVYLNGASTTIESWNFTHTITPRYTIDQTADWNAGRSLNFGVDDIGTIRLNQTWETHFLLRMMQGGNINIFGPGSVISFDGGNSTLSLPDTFITAVPNLTAAGVNFTTLQIEHFASPNRDNVTDTLQLTWELNYSGQFPVTQLLRYQRQGDPSFVQFRKLTATPPFASPLPQSTTLDIRKLNPGEYRIWIIARAADAPDDTKYLDGWITFGTAGGAYIRIQ